MRYVVEPSTCTLRGPTDTPIDGWPNRVLRKFEVLEIRPDGTRKLSYDFPDPRKIFGVVGYV